MSGAPRGDPCAAEVERKIGRIEDSMVLEDHRMETDRLRHVTEVCHANSC
jgi:hypothetical protein